MKLSSPVKFILFSFLFLFLGILLALFSSSFQTSSSKQPVLEQLSLTLDREKALVEAQLKQIRDDFILIAESSEVTGTTVFFAQESEKQVNADLLLLKKRLHGSFSSFSQKYPEILDVSLSHANFYRGAVLSVSAQVSQSPSSSTLSSAPVFNKNEIPSFLKDSQLLKTSEVFYSAFHLDQEQKKANSTPRVVFEMATPLRNNTDTVSLILSLKIDLGKLAQNLQPKPNSNITYFLIDSAGDYLFHADPQKLMRVELGIPIRLLDDYSFGDLNRYFKAGKQKDLSLISRRKNLALVLKQISFDVLNPERKIAIVALKPRSN